MSISILDTCVLVKLAKAHAMARLQELPLPAATTDIVDGEMTAERDKYPDALTYEAARDAGMLTVHAIAVGSAAYAEFIRLRQTRVNPKRNRGEDSCVALALVTPGSVVYFDDGDATKMARRELGTAARVFSSANI